jgi:hypothetical protein
MRWVERYKKDGNVDIHYRKPIAYKVKREYVEFLLQELKNNKTITLQELLQKLKDKYKGVDLTTTQIFRVIKDNNITRIRHEPVKRFGKDIDINTNIKKFYEEIKKHKIEDIICIDETSIKSLQKYKESIGFRCIYCFTDFPYIFFNFLYISPDNSVFSFTNSNCFMSS